MPEARQRVQVPEHGGAPATVGLWVRWVAGNALGEFLGLGILGLVIGTFASRLSFELPPLLMLAGILALGTLEGVLVGASQWLALRRALPEVRASAWIRATALGALLAWVLGMLPSTLMDLAASSSASQAPPPEISDGVQLLLAAGLGLVAGPILAGTQWRVLRRYVRGAGWWIPANSVAWAFGMPIVFAAVGTVAEGGFSLRLALFGLAMMAVTGAVVGMVHGLVLVELLRRATEGDAGGGSRPAGAGTPCASGASARRHSGHLGPRAG